MLERLAEYDIDFVEQPVRETPRGQLGELRRRSPVAVCANEGLWSEDDAYARIRAREADVYCFSPSWVGSLTAFSRLAHVAELEGLQICKHTHGELGITAAACQHVLLTLPNMSRRAPADRADDGARRAHARRSRSRPAPRWGRIDGPGLGVEVDADAVAEAAGRYRSEGQYLPWQAFQIGREERHERTSGRQGRARRRRRLGHGPRRRRRDGERRRARRGRRHRPRARRDRCRRAAAASRSRSTSATPRASSAWSRRTVERFGRLDVVYHCAVDVPFVNTQDRRLTELDEAVWTRMIDLVPDRRLPRRQVRRPPDADAGLGLDHPLEHRRRARRLRGPRLVHRGQGRRHGAHALARGRTRARRHPRERDRAELRLHASRRRSGSRTTPRARRSSSCTCSRSRRPEEIAPLVVYLASDESRRMTGAVIPLDSRLHGLQGEAST